MPTTKFIHSGVSGVAGQALSLSAVRQDIELSLPLDLDTILTAFKTALAVNVVIPKLVDLPSDPNFIVIQYGGFDIDPVAHEGYYSFNFHLGKPGNKDVLPTSSQHIDYTLSRLKRLLLANPNFGGLAGIRTITGLSGDSGNGIYNKPGLQQATLTVVYAVSQPELNLANPGSVSVAT